MESEIGGRSEAGIESFQRAVYIDPRFAAAYSGLADSYAALGYLSYVAPRDAFPTAQRHATKALELDATLAEPHASLGLVKLYFDWDWLGADAEFQRAIALDPDYAPTHEWYSIYLLVAGRATEAFQEIQLARQRDPLSLPINSDLGFHHYYTGRYDEAVKQLKFVLEMNQNFPPAHLWLGRTFQELGKFDEALAEFRQVEEALREWPVSISARGFVSAVAAAPGRRDCRSDGAGLDRKRTSLRRRPRLPWVQCVDFGMSAACPAPSWNEGATPARLPLGREYVAVAILCQCAGVRHQPVSTRNGELVGDRAIEDPPSRFDSHLRILIDGKLPLGIC